MENKNWIGFNKGVWQDEINVRDFIQTNYNEYTGDSSFLAGATERTANLMKKLSLFLLLSDSSAAFWILILLQYLHLPAILPVILIKTTRLLLDCRQTVP